MNALQAHLQRWRYIRSKGAVTWIAGIVAGLIVATTTIGIATLNFTGFGDRQATQETEGLTSLQENINDRCQRIVKQSSESYLVDNYTFEGMSRVEIDDNRLVADVKRGAELERPLNSDCSYSWSGIQVDSAKWSINVSAVNPGNPEIDVEADKQ